MGTNFWQLIQLAIVPATYGLVRYGSPWNVAARAGFVGCFAILSGILFVVRFVWARILWPIWFSPLTKLPQPKVSIHSGQPM